MYNLSVVFTLEQIILSELFVLSCLSETMSQLSRISHTLSVVFPGRPDEFIQQTVVRVHLGAPLSPELHVKVCARQILTF